MDAGLTDARTQTAQAGFSLLEVMVSVAVLAVLAVGAGLVTGGGVSATERDADRFERAHQQTYALAIMGREARGLLVTPNGLALAHWRDASWQGGATLYDWRGQGSFAASAGLARSGDPEIVFYPDGRSTAFSMIFSGGGAVWRCASDGWSAVSCVPE